MNIIYTAKYIYKVIRLFFIALLLTYFLGCMWYFFTKQNLFSNPESETFNYQYNLDSYDSNIQRLVLCCYFALTTLSTVGYGDLVPKNNAEKIIGIIIMILGIAFFSYIMGNFNDVLVNYDKINGIKHLGSDL